MTEQLRKKLLVADDREDVAVAVQKMLSPFYDVDIATSGLEVRQKCLATNYYGLLIDVSFESGISGMETATLVRSTDKEIKIIVFSGYEYSDSVRRRVIEIGAQFMEKPLMLDAVQHKLRDDA